MNTLIKQLAEQAGATHKQNLGVYQFYENELQQFAELIAEMCAKVCEVEASVIVTNASEQFQEGKAMGATVCAAAIRERMK